MCRIVAELVDIAEKENILISEVMIRQEMEVKEQTREEVYAEMERNLDVMEKAIDASLKGVTSVTGLTGRDAVLIQECMKNESPLSGHVMLDVVSKSMGPKEVNAAMSMVSATRTAGSAGCVPGTF